MFPEAMGSPRGLLSWAVTSPSELFFGKMPVVAAVVGQGLVGVEGEEVR